MTTSFFAGAQHVTIEGGNFSNVNGNQINNNNATYQYIYTKQKKERTEYDDYYKVKRGAIDRIKEITHYTYPRRWDDGYRWATEEGFARADKVISTARVNGEEGKVFTVVSYSGPEAQEPHLGCWPSEIWMDPSTGALCRGPDCPEEFPIRIPPPLRLSSVPFDLNVLEKDVYLRYLTNVETGARQAIVDIVSCISATYFTESWISNVLQPTISSTSTKTTIAVGSTEWWIDGKLFGMREVLASGVTRFALLDEAHGEHYFTLKTRISNDRQVWLSQAMHVFSACGISLENDMRDYKLLLPQLELEGHLPACEDRSRKAVYLFVPPLPSSSSLDSARYVDFTSHYWSSYHTGEPRLTSDECKSLDLPHTLLLSVRPSIMQSWDALSYKTMHQLQTAKGFDPITTAFAEYLQYPTYRVMKADPGRFEEVNDCEGE
ncbi:hypothetical protein V5O48_016091 [Marasmius crinis-equi]|uniref:Uncharacterized protein n=1 Tax=Marasmius crinis-equi TaxID=585013 RepID=A0ABR3ET02_9AGAR